MEFINEEVQEKLGLTPEQVEGIKPLYNDHIATVKGEWDGKANEQAEGILNGVVESTLKRTGLDLKREQGEKYADYITRLTDAHLTASKDNVSKLEAEYKSKLKDFKGGDALQSELDEAKAKLDEAQQKYADYDDLKEKAEKFEPLQSDFERMQQEVSFSKVKPSFAEGVNEYEAKAKWNEFKDSVYKDWDVKLVDGEPTCINKENPHKTIKLQELVDKDEVLTALKNGRQQKGSGTKVTTHKIEGVPFEVPEGADSATRAALIREYLEKSGIDSMSPEYSAKFAELNNKIKQKTA